VSCRTDGAATALAASGDAAGDRAAAAEPPAGSAELATETVETPKTAMEAGETPAEPAAIIMAGGDDPDSAPAARTAAAEPTAEVPAAPPAEAEAPMPESVPATGAGQAGEAYEAATQDSFIAPPPVEPEATAEAAEAEPFAAAAMANGSRAPRSAAHAAAVGFDRKKAQSLFAKMTGGAARVLQAATQGGEPPAPGQVGATEGTTRRTVSAQPADRTSTESATKPAAQSAPREPAQAAAQPQLSGLDPSDRIGSRQADEDLLEIPAFLRRQAN
ncbi:MAG: hypothetical protein ACE5KF_07215, partial [Kiloniellaceae bacterium]